MSVIIVTGASSGFGAFTSRALADAGHVVFAGMRDTAGRNAPAVEALQQYASDRHVDLRYVELDVQSQESADAAIQSIIGQAGGLDVVVHNAGHMVFGPTEAFTPEQLAAVYDVNVLGTQRVNRAVLPHFRANRRGLLLWVGSTSTRGGTPPYLAPYFAAKAGMDALAVSYAGELARWGIESSIIVPGAFTSGTNHFAHAGRPADEIRAAEYQTGPTAGLDKEIREGFGKAVPTNADVSAVAAAVVNVVGMPFGQRPFRVHVDFAHDGAEIVDPVADFVRASFLNRIGLGDLLHAAR